MTQKIKDIAKLNKKELKDYVNGNGFFTAALISRETNMPEEMQSKIPEGAVYFSAIASNGELNRNGYMIRETAFVPAINQYLKEGGTLLLQHDMNQPIGKVLTATVLNGDVLIEGYVFDDLTENRFSRGLFNAVSTGHLTKAVEFENTQTGQVISEEEFRKLSWEEQDKDYWVMAVTALEWVENSIVSIGANRKSLVEKREVVKNYIETIRNEVAPADEAVEPIEETKEEVVEAPVETPVEEVKEEETPEEVVEEKKEVAEEVNPERTETEKVEGTEEVKAEEVKEEETVEDDEVEPVEEDSTKEEQAETKPLEVETKEEETPPAPVEVAENAVKTEETSVVEVSAAEVSEVNKAFKSLAKIILEQNAKIASLEKNLGNIPVRKGLIFSQNPMSNEQKKPEGSFLGQLFEANGITIS